MNESDRIEMMRAAAGELSAEERAAFERKWSADDALHAEWVEVQKIAELLEESRAESFKPFFASRVMHRIEETKEESIADALIWLFRPLVPVALILIAFLALSNWNERELVGDDASVLEAVFVAVPASAEAVYVMDM